jgi:hypothetical protein
MDNLKKMEPILQSVRDRLIPEIPIFELREADRLFRELHSYDQHLQRLTPETEMDTESLAQQKAEIEFCCSRLEELFARKLFLPQRVFDTLEIIHEHCPSIGRRILTEFWELDRIKPTKKTHAGETIPAYVLRCLKKFQALVTKNREALQNTEIFLQLAQQQFGAMTGETIGISNVQTDILEEIVVRISTRPELMEALSAALIFQEIGKLPLYLEEYRSLSHSNTHGVAGAEILRRQALLQRLGLDEDTSRLTNSLVEVHGLMGHVLLGEVALPALDLVTSSGDEQFFEAFFIHSVLAAAAYREGIMVEDLLDRFLDLRQVALNVIRGETSWQSYLDEQWEEKGRSLLTDMDSTGSVPAQLALFSEWDTLVDKHSHHLKGKDAAAIERIFRLVGLPDIDFVDIQMKILDMPVTFIYHKKGLKSTGLQKFEEDLQRAMVVHKAVMGLSDTIRRYLLDQLNSSRDSIRIYGLEYVARSLAPENWLKLLFLGFRGLDRFCPGNGKPRVIDLHDLSLIIDRRYQAIAEELAALPVDRLFEDSRLLSRLAGASEGIILNYNPDEGVVKTLYQDRLDIQLVLQQMQEQQEILRLKNLYHRELKKLKNYIYYTEDYQKLLSDTFHERLQKLIEQALKDLQKRMRQQRSFSGIERVFAEIMALAEENAFSEEQLLLVTDMYEFNRDRLRSRRLEAIYLEIHDCSTTAELFELWQKIRTELMNNQSHLGKEFEDLVTSRFDQQLEELERS